MGGIWVFCVFRVIAMQDTWLGVSLMHVRGVLCVAEGPASNITRNQVVYTIWNCPIADRPSHL